MKLLRKKIGVYFVNMKTKIKTLYTKNHNFKITQQIYIYYTTLNESYIWFDTF